MIQITRAGTIAAGSQESEQALRAEFDEKHCVRICQFLEPGLLELVQRGLEHAEFYDRAHGDIGLELCMADNHLSGLLHFLTSSPPLFEAIERITGCGRIGSFEGRVYRMIPGGGHYDSWHGDTGNQRMIGMSVNLSAAPYSGGVFQLREHHDGPIRCEVANTGFGDAILFRISPYLFHRVTPVEGTAAKTAFAGWYVPQPHWHPLVRAAAQGVLQDESKRS
jgi:hypothetical protein